MNNNIFKSGKHNWTESVEVGGRFVTEYAYAIGYWEAGDYLVEKAKELRSPQKGRLFFPICFCYRQSIELVLKKLIVLAEMFYTKSEGIGYEIKKMSKLRTDELNDTHSLEKLLTWLIGVLECVSEEVFSEDIRSLIIEFHDFDPNGQRFRYGEDKHGNCSFPIEQSYSLLKIKEEITRVMNYLAGIDAWIDHYNSMANNIIETYDPW